MFNQFITLLQGFFSIAFWFGSFLPVAIVAGVHLLVGALQYEKADRLTSLLTSARTDTWGTFLSVAILVAIAYAVTPLVPLFRGWLDGTQLPPWLHDALRRKHIAYTHSVRADISSASSVWNAWSLRSAGLEKSLWEPRRAGQALVAASDQASILEAEKLIVDLGKSIDAGELPSGKDADDAGSALQKALKKNSANLPPDHPDHINSMKLELAHRKMISILHDAANESRHRLSVLALRYATLSIDEPQATRVADVRVLTQRYSATVYGAEFNFLWPRLQLVLPDQRALLDRIAGAQSQTDFSVLLLVLLATVPAIWIPVLACMANSPWLFLSIGILSPLALGFCYELVVQAQIAQGEIVKGVVDKYRLEVLTKVMRQPLPMSRASERELWSRVSTAEETGPLADFPYKHPAS